MSEQEIETLANKIGEVAPDQVRNFLTNPDAFDYTVLEGYSDFTDKYRNVADFLGDKAGIKATIWKDLDGKFPSKARFNSLQEKYPWLSEEELKEWFDKSNEYKQFYKDERKKAAAKARREREVKGTYVDMVNPEESSDRNWGFWRNLLASDYEKQRYINEPDAALFGYDAPKIGDAPKVRWGATGDLALGSAGAVADALPGVGKSLIGPGIRAGRDVAHKVTDSPYQKDWTQIGWDAFTDVGTNLGAALLFNARKGAKLASNASDPEVKRSLEAARETAHIKAGLPQIAEHMHLPSQLEIDFYRAHKLPYPSSDRAIRNAVNDMPDSELKQELSKVVYTEPGRPINRDEVQRIYQTYLTQTQPGMRETVRMADDYMRPMSKIADEPVTHYLRNAADASTFTDLNKYQKAQYLANKLAMGINSGKIGQIAVQEGANYKGRGSSPKIVETALTKKETKETIDRLISSYSLLWNKDKEPAEAKNSPIIKAAWEKWRNQ